MQQILDNTYANITRHCSSFLRDAVFPKCPDPIVSLLRRLNVCPYRFQRVNLGDILGYTIEFPLNDSRQFHLLREAIKIGAKILFHPIDYKKGFQTISFHISRNDPENMQRVFKQLVEDTLNK